ncbi:MAG: WecB/TagA/CpsF family glycosyltransferase [Alphaproteobacteria bacterium]
MPQQRISARRMLSVAPDTHRRDPRAKVFGIDIDATTSASAVECVLSWCRLGWRKLVVTPNLDHVVALRTNPALVAAYARADLVLADGMPLVWASRLGGPRLPERVTGADLIEPLCRAAALEGLTVFFLGSRLPVLEEAARRLSARAPGLQIVGMYEPPHGAAFDAAEDDRIVEAVRAARPDILFVALGMPKQELWAARNLDRLETHAVLCIGAGLDYIAGKVARAPRMLQRIGLEWLWRMLSEPSRLGSRYLRDIAWVPRLFLEQIAYVWRRRP